MRPPLLLVICLVVALLPPGPPERGRASAAAGEPVGCTTAGFSPGAGIMWESDSDLQRDLDEMVAVGASWVRLDFGWTNMEPSKGTYDWSNTDRVLNAVTARGLKVVAILHATPAWARAAGTNNIFYPPTNPADYANFVERTVGRYSTKVKVWELLNEPNISRFWQPAPDPAAYTALLKAGYAAARKADPASTVLSAGLSPAVDAADGSQIAPATFLRRIYENGGQGSFDAVAIHPYSFPARPIDPKTDFWNTFHRMPLLYDLMLRNGDGDKKVWITEFGATTGTAPDAVTEAEHAAIIAESFRAMAQLPFVAGPMFIYAIRDAGIDAAEREDNFGLLRRDFSPKASRAAYLQASAVCLSTQPATLSISDATMLEGSSGPNTATFTITRTGDSSGTSSVRYATLAGTAVADSDFTAVSPTTVTFSAGQTSKTVSVSVFGGVGAEPDETFSVKLSSPTGASIADDTGLATIVNDDAFPTLAIDDVALVEGATGTTSATFTITRSGVTSGTSSVQYATVAGTAAAGTDFVAAGPSTVQFAGGESAKTVSVSVNGDRTGEPNESFSVKLSSPADAVVADDTGVGTIIDDDGVSTYLSVDDVNVSEGLLLGATTAFTITRTGVTSGTSSVRYATADGTATAGSDYTGAAATTVTFAPGETTKSVPFTILADLANEPNETVLLNLSSPTGAVISDAQGVATIVDDDILLGLLATPGPSTFVTIADATAVEGSSETTNATFTVVRTGIVTSPSSVQYTTGNGTAAAGADFVGVGATTLSFAAGETVKTVAVAVKGDTTIEPAETFSVTLSAPSGVTISDDTAVGTILDDDVLPTVSIGDATVIEGSSGTTTATFTLTRSGGTAGASSVQYATSAGTASAGSDFVAAAPTTVTFAAGESAKSVTVSIATDTVDEPEERFSVTLSSASGATIADDTGTGTIIDDDILPTVAVSNVALPVADIDTWAIFGVTRSGNTAAASSVKYSTAPGTAAEGTDYLGVSPTTLTFAERETYKIVTVQVKANAVDSSETFSLNLSAPTGAAIADGQGAAEVLPAPVTTSVSGGARYNPVTPARILDTRFGNGAATGTVAPGASLDLQVTGRGGVPADGVSAVVLNVTATEPTEAGYVTAYPTGETRPLASNLNFSKAQTVANLVVVKLGAGGKVSLFNAGGTVHLIADVAGWYGSSTATAGSRYNPLTPSRILDTRFGTGAPQAAVGPNGTLELQVTGRGGVPASGVAAVVLNVTATGPTTTSYLTAYPTGEGRPVASNLNFNASQTVPNLVMVKVGTGGKVSLYNSSGTVDMIADVAGWYDTGTSTSGSRYNPVTPARILDTRDGTGGFGAQLGAAASVDLQVTGRGGVPANGVSAVILNVTITSPNALSFLTAFPAGEAQPLASNLNFTPGRTVPNLVVVKVGTGGKVRLYNNAGNVDVIADVAGWYGTS